MVRIFPGQESTEPSLRADDPLVHDGLLCCSCRASCLASQRAGDPVGAPNGGLNVRNVPGPPLFGATAEVKFSHPGPGEQLPQAGLGIGRFQQFHPYSAVVSYCLPACSNDGVSCCIPVHITNLYEGRGRPRALDGSNNPSNLITRDGNGQTRERPSPDPRGGCCAAEWQAIGRTKPAVWRQGCAALWTWRGPVLAFGNRQSASGVRDGLGRGPGREGGGGDRGRLRAGGRDPVETGPGKGMAAGVTRARRAWSPGTRVTAWLLRPAPCRRRRRVRRR